MFRYMVSKLNKKQKQKPIPVIMNYDIYDNLFSPNNKKIDLNVNFNQYVLEINDVKCIERKLYTIYE